MPSVYKKAMQLFREKRTEEWLTPKLYTGKSICEMGTCDCTKTVGYEPTDRERRWIERLRETEKNEPEFVTKNKQEMIRLIEAGRSGEIEYDEWGEVYYPVDPEKR